MKKTFYPTGAYRLLTGGINHGEAIFDCPATRNKRGNRAGSRSQTLPRCRCLLTAATGEQPVFYTFAFLLDEVGGTLGVIDEDERVEAFLEIEPAELPQHAALLEQLDGPRSAQRSTGSWSDWGKFRAAIHQLVWEALNTTAA